MTMKLYCQPDPVNNGMYFPSAAIVTDIINIDCSEANGLFIHTRYSGNSTQVPIEKYDNLILTALDGTEKEFNLKDKSFISAFNYFLIKSGTTPKVQ
jgi:hypothetical protein